MFGINGWARPGLIGGERRWAEEDAERLRADALFERLLDWPDQALLAEMRIAVYGDERT